MERKYPIKEYEIWIGNYSLGEGYTSPSEPVIVDKIIAPNFKVACVIYELKSSLKSIEQGIKKDEYIDPQSCKWFYNFDKNENSWTGKYFKSKQEALKSFN